MFTSLHKNFPSIRRNREEGFTLVEILVALAVFAIVAAISTSLIVTWNNSANKFGTTATTQNDVSNAVSTITRDISAANQITEASPYMIHLNAQEDGATTEIAIFATGITGVTGPKGIDTSKVPAGKNLVEYRKTAAGAVSARVLVANYDPSESSQPLFKYYDKDNGTISAPVAADDIEKIIRVQIIVSTKLSERGTPVELASSASPRTAAALTTKQYPGYGLGDPENPTGGKISAPILEGRITTPATTGQLTWSTPGGATGYALYVKPEGATSFTSVSVISNPSTRNFNHTGLTLGKKYTYYVTATSPYGPSDPSNQITLTVLPPAPVISNINTTKSLTAAKSGTAAETGTSYIFAGAKYTVARDLVNQVVWAPSNGAESYTIFRNGDPITTVSDTGAASYAYQDKNTSLGPNYGRTTKYAVIATNSGYNSGGSSTASNQATLISPPSASPMTGDAQSSSTHSTYSSNLITVTTRAANTDGWNVKRETTQNATTNSTCANAVDVSGLSFTGSSVTDTVNGQGVRWGSATCYIATPYNDAGNGQSTRVLDVDQMPAPFTISSDQTGTRKQIEQYAGAEQSTGQWQSYNGTNGQITVKWPGATGNSSPYGAATYWVNANRDFGWARGAAREGMGTVAKSINDNSAAWSVDFKDTTPGIRYYFTVNAKANNGEVRGQTQSFGTVTDLDTPRAWNERIQRNGSNYRIVLQVTENAYYGISSFTQGGYQFDDMGSPGWVSNLGETTSSTHGNPGCNNFCTTIGTTGQVRTYLAAGAWGQGAVASMGIQWKGFISWWYPAGAPNDGWGDVSWDSDYKFRSLI